MPWFIIQSERKTWTKYLVEADNMEGALDACDKWEYIGYVDGEDTCSRVVAGGFATEAEALDDDQAYVDG